MAKKQVKYRVCQGQKVRGVNDGDVVRIFQAGEVLPDDYKVDETFISNKIVEEVKHG